MGKVLLVGGPRSVEPSSLADTLRQWSKLLFVLSWAVITT